jgi:hypothetical protein
MLRGAGSHVSFGHGPRSGRKDVEQRALLINNACITSFAITIYIRHIATQGLGHTDDTDLLCT